MKVTYFNPSQTTITFADTATFGAGPFTYFPNGFTSSDCAKLTPDNTSNVNIPNSLVFVRDTRNKQVYKVKRMVDNKCWMIDNLKYQGPTDRDGTPIQNYDGAGGTAGSTGLVFRNGRGPNMPTSGTSLYNTVDGSGTQSATNSNKAFWNNPMSYVTCYSGLNGGNPTTATNTLTHCGYYYNWFAATGGTGTYDSNGMSTSGNQATGSICPANFRLPSGMSGTGGPTTNGINYTHADFPVLNTSMINEVLSTGGTTNDTTTVPNWQPNAQWAGSLAGYWSIGLTNMGSMGAFWSSTAEATDFARSLGIYTTDVDTGNYIADKYYGNAVRCVMP